MSESAFEPVFVVQFGGRSSKKCTRNNYNRRKNKSRLCNNWHNNLYDSLLQVHMALSSSCTLFLLIFLVILCSIDGGGGEDVSKGREITSSSFSNSNTNFPTFDVNDLKNLIEIFPEFREYVYNVVSSQVEKQKQELQQQLQQQTTTARTIVPLSTTSGYNVFDGGTSQNSRKDVFSWTNQQKKQETGGSTAKHSYGWPHYDDYHPQHYPSHSHYDHYKKPYGYGYSPSPSPSYGWSPQPSHHHDDTYKDPKFHYEVGYQLGKDVSCVLGLLGFKSIKDFSIHSVFSFLKKLKYVVLIGLAFKLGVVLSPIALPLLFPVILLAVIAKILPLILIICLLFKLLKTQLKLGIGRKVDTSVGDVVWQRGLDLLEGTNISSLWSSVDAVTQRVSESESCVEKIICKMVQKWDGNDRSNITYVYGSSRKRRMSGLLRNDFSGRRVVSSFLTNITDWMYARYRNFDDDSSMEKNWECDNIPCYLLDYREP